ncbi:conserved hypothetical protein [Thioalkalivibrio sulfidiphilus HL-EbGr7]|uniref:Glycosyltransferase n=1 Tax=Thioalkalivibrio sulfidiphilus (strain HL-EbGR7) TaxID=396588 RepID=B8GL56_THISH|nr:hypothetical protein [Thioalkalivibrio sulfidiphilus]ACL71574.1 conserved hypothetical protein [Thioalkalivibrio sulfidiphilus HL-EbGr7]
MKQIVCMKWGSLYGADYANKLYGMVRRNLSGDFRFVCLTDDPTGLRQEIETRPCPEIPIPAPYNNRGWRKLTLWKSTIFDLPGDWLYLDLDVVVTDSLEPFFEYDKDASFIVMQNWTQPGQGIGNTSVYRFRVGAHDYLYDELVGNTEGVLSSYRNSQTYISRTAKSIGFWPDPWCTLFKVQCVPGFPARWWKTPVVPPGCRVIAFPGVPNPHEALAGHWPAKWYKRIYKHIRPATWIRDYWRE